MGTGQFWLLFWLGGYQVSSEASRILVPAPPQRPSPTFFPGEKSHWKHLPICWLSGVTGPPTESSKGSQGTRRAHLEGGGRAWLQGLGGGAGVSRQPPATPPAGPTPVPPSPEHTHTCPGAWPRPRPQGPASSPAQPPPPPPPPAQVLGGRPLMPAAYYFRDTGRQEINFLFLLWLPGSSKLSSCPRSVWEQEFPGDLSWPPGFPHPG